MSKVSVVVLNWNGQAFLGDALKSLEAQSEPAEIVVVDNDSSDQSVELINSQFPSVTLIQNDKNLGFAGGVNVGIKYAIKSKHDFVALFNNDAKADSNWLKHLVDKLKNDPRVGIATGKFLDFDGQHIDSTGDIYTPAVPACTELQCSSESVCSTRISLLITKMSTSVSVPSWLAGK